MSGDRCLNQALGDVFVVAFWGHQPAINVKDPVFLVFQVAIGGSEGQENVHDKTYINHDLQQTSVFKNHHGSSQTRFADDAMLVFFWLLGEKKTETKD